MATTARSAPSSQNHTKLVLWSLFALMGLAVFFFHDLAVLRNPADPAYSRWLVGRLFLIPHALTAVTAILIGPIQFSSRFRRRYLNLHRLLGKIYVCCVMVAGPTAIGVGHTAPWILFFAGITQAVLWMALTIAAFFTARNGQIAQHRQWMVRSYGVGCTIFVFTRFGDFIPPLRANSPAELSIHIMFYMLLAVVLPSFYFGWHEITTRRSTTTKVSS